MKLYRNSELSEYIEIPVYDHIEIGSDKIIVSQNDLVRIINEDRQKTFQKIYDNGTDLRYRYSSFQDLMENFEFLRDEFTGLLQKPISAPDCRMADVIFSAARLEERP